MRLNQQMLFLGILSATATAQAISQEEVLDELPSSRAQKSLPITQPSKHNTIDKTTRAEVTPSNHTGAISGNLPNYAIRTQPVTEFSTPPVIPKNNDFDALVELRKGDTLRAVIAQDLVAYTASKAPVTARVLEGKFKGALLLGEASMDPTTKRANVNFNTIRPLKSTESYSFIGELMASDGIRGLDGEYESSYWTYFWAETITNAVAGIASANTLQTPTALGYVTTPGPSNQINQGAAIGLSRTAERLGDRVKTAPEMTTIKGPIIVQITVLK